MWNRIRVEGCLTFPVNLRWFRVLVPYSTATKDCRLARGINLDYRENVFGNEHETFDSLRDHPRRIQSASEDIVSQGRIPMPTFATKPSTTSSTMPVEIPQNNMVGQQRQQISELQFDNFPNAPSFSM